MKFFLFLLCNLFFLNATNCQSLFLWSTIQQSNQVDRAIDFSASVRQIASTSPLNAEFKLLYKKSNTASWNVWPSSVLAVVAPQSTVIVSIAGVQIQGNSGNYDLAIAYRNISTGRWYKVSEFKINNAIAYPNPQTTLLTFANPLEDLEQILDNIETGLKYLHHTINTYSFLADASPDIKREIKKITNVQEAISKANQVLSLVNDLNNFMNEPDDVKRYFKFMKLLASNTLPPPLNKIVKSYADVGEAFVTAIDNIINNYGNQTFPLAPYAYSINFKVRRTDYYFTGNAFDQYYQRSEIEKFISGYSIIVYDVNGNLVKKEAIHSEYGLGNETIIKLDLFASLEFLGGQGNRIFFMIEFMNGQAVIIPLSNNVFVGFDNTRINAAIDVRLNNAYDLQNRFKVSVFKP